MKLNWGAGIVIAMALFIGFILYFVITMSIDSAYSHDLVVEDYYKKEIGFQEELDAEENAALLPEKVTIQKNASGVTITFPEEIAEAIDNGKVSFYRVSDKRLDFEKDVVLNNRKMHISESELVPGRWDISLRWNANETTYLIKEKILF